MGFIDLVLEKLDFSMRDSQQFIDSNEEEFDSEYEDEFYLDSDEEF